jgi:putative endonuclease
LVKIHTYYVYILTNVNNTVVYIGVTNDLVRRTSEHKSKLNNGFTEKYNVNILIYYELFDFVDLAIAREKELKGWSRAKKNALVNSKNPKWLELFANGKVERI